MNEVKRWRVRRRLRGARVGAVIEATEAQIAPWRHMVELVEDELPAPPGRSVVVDRAMHAPPVATVIS
jgi:hypothetical protein